MSAMWKKFQGLLEIRAQARSLKGRERVRVMEKTSRKMMTLKRVTTVKKITVCTASLL